MKPPAYEVPSPDEVQRIDAATDSKALDDALCGIASRLSRGIEVSDEIPAVDLIAEAGWDGHYLAQPHKARHDREEHFRSGLPRRDARQALAVPAA